jgi:PAS domain S-box-containing protein
MPTGRRAASKPTGPPPSAGDRLPHFARIVEQAGVGIWTHDLSGATDYVNDRLAAMLGYPPAEMIGRRFTEYIRPASAVWAEATFDARSLAASEQDGLCDLLTRDGRLLQVHYHASPIRDSGGALSGALAVITPTMASQPESAAASERREREVESLFYSAPIGLCVVSRALRFVRANRRLAAIDGLAVDAHVGRTVREVLPAVADQFEPVLRSVIEGGAPAGDVELIAGARVWTAGCSPIRDRAGTVLAVTVAIDDVTDARQTAASLRHFAFLVHNASDFIGMCDLEFRPFFVNKAGADAVSLAEKPDASVFDFFFEEDHEFLRTTFFPLVLREGRASTEIRFRQFRTGEPVWMQYNVLRMDDADGRPIGFATISQDLSERKRAEDRLKQIAAEKDAALRRFRELADSMPQIVWSTASDGTIDYLNRRWYELTRTTRLHERDPFSFVHPDDRARATLQWGVSVATGSPLELEVRLKFPADAEYRWFVARGLPVRDAAGAIVRWYGTHTDIHEWKVAEAMLSESRERLQAALEASATGTFRWSVQTNELDWDRSLDRLFGLAPGQSPRTIEGFISRVHPDDRAAVVAHCERCASEGADFGMEFRVVWPDGAVRWLADRGRSYVDAEGRPVYMTGACVDITDRKSAEERLAYKRRILEMIARGAPLAETLSAIVALLEAHWPDAIASVMLVDDDGRLHVGAAPGLPPAYAAALEGTGIGPAVGSCGTAAFRREPVIVSDIEHDALWADYRHLALPHDLRACWSVPIVTSTDRLVGTIAVYYREPRVPHAAERDFATDAAASLAAIAIEKSLTEQELHEQARALAAANQNKDEFLARLAHELRNPLGAIQAALELFRLRLDDESPLQHPRAVIDRQTRHIVRLIDDLSDLSRIGTGKIELRRQRVDVAQIAADAAETVRPLAASRGQQLDVDVPATPAFVLGDPARLMQICVNLLNNAVKYTQVGGRIGVAVEEAGGTVSLRVRDNGLGIAPDMLSKVFDLYAQADAAAEHAQGGVGIGLHLVQSLVRLHGGSVTATSAGVGLGSEFEVRLPADTGTVVAT